MSKGPKQFKVDAIKDIKDKSSKSKIMILTDHQGLTVAQMTTLRNKLFTVDARYHVVKNTLTAKAVEPEIASQIGTLLNGATSIIFGYGDVVAPAKILTAFYKEFEKPGIKGAVMDGKLLDVSELKKLATLPSREVLLARMLAGFNSPIVGFVNVLQGPIRKLVYALNEIQKQKGV